MHEWVSEQSFHRESAILLFSVNLLRLWVFNFFLNWKQHKWILDSGSKPQCIVSELCNNDQFRPWCNSFIQNNYFNIFYKRLNSCWEYLQGLSKAREHPKSLKFQWHSKFEILHPTPRWCIPASYSDILAIPPKWCSF